MSMTMTAELYVVAAWIVALTLAFGMQLKIASMYEYNTNMLATGIPLILLTTVVYACRIGWREAPSRPRMSNDSERLLAYDGAFEADPEAEIVKTELHQEHFAHVQYLHSAQLYKSECAPSRRLHFLDNLKTFLTFLVVTMHVACAFGGCGRFWYIVVGDCPSPFRSVAKSFALLTQAFVMPLFFLVSAYFTPASYDKGKGHFFTSKAKRCWLPAMATTFTVSPLSQMMAKSVGQDEVGYLPQIGHAWFLFWLLIFNWAYSTLREASCSDPKSAVTSNRPWPFPSWCTRVGCGAVVCGLLTGVLILSIPDNFWGVPVTIGSFPCDVLMFGVGVIASQSKWLVSSLRENIDISVPALRVIVILEGLALVVLHQLWEQDEAYGIYLILAAGVFCVDMCLAALQFFQEFANTQTFLTKAMADSAYTVYLLHPPVVTAATAAFVKIYNDMYGGVLEFDQYANSTNTLEGIGDGSLHLSIGWFCVFVLSHLICWPLAWWIRHLPGFNQVL